MDDDGPADFQTIQEAINTAEEGDTIFVYNGIYYENVVVNKSLSIVGENRSITIIDGNYGRNVINITASYVNITGFTIENSGTYSRYCAVYVTESSAGRVLIIFGRLSSL